MDNSKIQGASVAPTATSDLLSAALAYARSGFYVLPLDGKRPLTEHGVHDATRDEDVIRAWWARWPEANIGIATGRALPAGGFLVVIDIDPRNGGWGSASALEANGNPFAPGRTIQTGGRGVHFYRRATSPMADGKLAKGIDIKGSGYVVAPPSVHHETGEPYVTIDDGAIPELEAWIAVTLTAKVRTEAEQPAPLEPSSPAWAETVTMGEEVARTMPPSMCNGDGSKNLMAVAAVLRIDLALPPETCKGIIAKNFNPRCTQADGVTPYPWPVEDIARAVANVKRERRLVLLDSTKAKFEAFKEAQRAKHGTIDRDAIKRLSERAANRPEPYEPPALTETGNAELFVELHGENVRYVPAWNRWLVWDGQRWRHDELESVAGMAKDVARARWKFHEDAAGKEAEHRTKLAKWAMQSESKRNRDNTIALAQAEDGIAVAHDALDADPWLLNVENGTVDLRTGELRAHDRGNLLTKQAPVHYDPDAVCPTWDAFLERVTGGSVELADFLARAVGYSLTGDVGEQVLFFLQGAGANGKSTFTLIVRELLGDYAKAAAPDLLLAKHGESHPTEIADLHGARFALCQEVEQGRRWAESTLKQLTGGDRVKARRMREDFWEFAPTHKLWVCANHKPQVRGADEGIWRRIKLVPFAVTIPEHERDPHLVDKLRAELPGILAWAVRGCLAWQRDGLGVPDDIKRATNEYRKEEDRVGAFIDEQCEVGDDFSVVVADLYAAYQRWAVASGEESLNKRTFSERVTMAGFSLATKSNGVWKRKGLRMRSAAPVLSMASRRTGT